ncbi:MAG: methyltransferase domain-containing protein [Desulfovibrionaceae bacterium]|jgi:demethylmenaquinone methyltransferase/2-methoxy-6-polyprenyl-1,4-benzoquinol methylase|nr:methyltransferase domain-containing protein [Desulfovibrionaceae bacterium]
MPERDHGAPSDTPSTARPDARPGAHPPPEPRGSGCQAPKPTRPVATDDEYARFARIYDPALHLFLEPIRLLAAQLVAESGAASAVDVCCGTARQAVLLRRAGVRRVAGADLSPAMLAVARAKWPHGVLARADARALPFADRAFQAAVLSFALHEKPAATREAILDDTLRVLAPGGVLAVADYRAPTGAAERTGHAAVAVVERMAGREHHANYRDFLRRGGIEPLLASRGLRAQRCGLFFLGAVGLFLARRD